MGSSSCFDEILIWEELLHLISGPLVFFNLNCVGHLPFLGFLGYILIISRICLTLHFILLSNFIIFCHQAYGLATIFLDFLFLLYNLVVSAMIFRFRCCYLCSILETSLYNLVASARSSVSEIVVRRWFRV